MATSSQKRRAKQAGFEIPSSDKTQSPKITENMQIALDWVTQMSAFLNPGGQLHSSEFFVPFDRDQRIRLTALIESAGFTVQVVGRGAIITKQPRSN